MQNDLEVSKFAQPGLAWHGSALPGPALKLHTSLNKNTKQIPESIKKKSKQNNPTVLTST